MSYRSLRHLLFRLDPEFSHNLAIKTLSSFSRFSPLKKAVKTCFPVQHSRLKQEILNLLTRSTPERLLNIAQAFREGLTLEEIQWLEFPLLTLFWSQIEILNMNYFQDCLCSGKVSITGRIEDLSLSGEILTRESTKLKELGVSPLKYICESGEQD